MEPPVTFTDPEFNPDAPDETEIDPVLPDDLLPLNEMLPAVTREFDVAMFTLPPFSVAVPPIAPTSPLDVGADAVLKSIGFVSTASTVSKRISPLKSPLPVVNKMLPPASEFEAPAFIVIPALPEPAANKTLPPSLLLLDPAFNFKLPPWLTALPPAKDT